MNILIAEIKFILSTVSAIYLRFGADQFSQNLMRLQTKSSCDNLPLLKANLVKNRKPNNYQI